MVTPHLWTKHPIMYRCLCMNVMRVASDSYLSKPTLQLALALGLLLPHRQSRLTVSPLRRTLGFTWISTWIEATAKEKGKWKSYTNGNNLFDYDMWCGWLVVYSLIQTLHISCSQSLSVSFCQSTSDWIFNLMPIISLIYLHVVACDWSRH